MLTFPAIPAKAGIYSSLGAYAVPDLDSRFRGNNDLSRDNVVNFENVNTT